MAIKRMVLGSWKVYPLPKIRNGKVPPLSNPEKLFKVPFPVKPGAHKLFGFEDRLDWVIYANGFADDDHKRLGKVRMSQVVATQEEVDESNVIPLAEEYLRGTKVDPPLVSPYKGKFYICDGHHRVCALYAIGKTEFEAYIVTPETT